MHICEWSRVSNKVFWNLELLPICDLLLSTSPWDLTVLKILFAFYLTLNLLMFQNTKMVSYYFKSLGEKLAILLEKEDICSYSLFKYQEV